MFIFLIYGGEILSDSFNLYFLKMSTGPPHNVTDDAMQKLYGMPLMSVTYFKITHSFFSFLKFGHTVFIVRKLIFLFKYFFNTQSCTQQVFL